MPTTRWIVTFFAAAAGLAQDPAPKRAPGCVELRIECTKRGTPVVRDPKATGENLAFQLVGREVRWTVGETACATREELVAALRAVYGNRRAWVPNPDKPGQLMPPDVQIKAQQGATFQDVVDAHDDAAHVRFEMIFVPGVGIRPFLLVQFKANEAVVDRGRLVLPTKRYQQPDDDPTSARPRFEVLQDGRIRQEGAVLFDPKRDHDSTTALVDRLRALGAEERQREQVERTEVFGERRDVTETHLLIVADKWVEWRHVERLLGCCAADDCVFWKIDLQVADANVARDAEADFVKEHAGR